MTGRDPRSLPSASPTGSAIQDKTFTLLAPHTLKTVRAWTYERALPFWIAHGIDPLHGGPVELLEYDGAALKQVPATRRTRVCGRQLYVFSQAHLLGLPGALDAAHQVFSYMTTKLWMGADRGWCRTASAEGIPLDLTPDLYDFAFCLYGLAWYLEASGRQIALEYANQTLDLVENLFRHGSEAGFHNTFPPTLPRQQNPHMHLLEAVLKLQTVIPARHHIRIARELTDLFVQRLYQPQSKALPEFFTDGLQPIAEACGAIRIEPGHHFEWAWILAQHQLVTGEDHSGLIRDLVLTAEALGVCQTSGLTLNAVDHTGKQLDTQSRTWPNTERIKGWLGLYEVTGTSPWPQVESACSALFRFHLGPCVPEGLWVDAFTQDGRLQTATTPASTFYHILLAFCEILRLAPE